MSDRPKHRHKDRTRQRRALSLVATVAVVAVVGSTSTGVFGTATPTSSEVDAALPFDATADDTVVQAQPVVDVKKAVAVAKEQATQPLPDLASMNLAELQEYAAKMQTEFVQASLAYEEAQTQADQASVAATQAEEAAVEAEEERLEIRERAKQGIRHLYSTQFQTDPVLRLLSGEDESVDDLLENMSTMQTASDLTSATVEEVDEASSVAEELSQEAIDLREAAEEAHADAEVLLDDIQSRASRVAAAANKALLNAGDETTLFASAEQEARNEAALQEWRKYLDLLDRADVVPPPAVDLVDPRALPFGLEILRSANGLPLSGVAAAQFKGETVTVLPRETIAAVSRAFAALGAPFVAGNDGTATYDCSGLTSAVFTSSGYPLDPAQPLAQYRQTSLVPSQNAQVGDLVFFTKKQVGIQHVGINLGGNLMLAADGAAQQVGVQQFPSEPFAFARPTMPRTTETGAPLANTAPSTAVDAASRCGVDPSTQTGDGMIYPLKEGTYEVSSEFGEPGSLWSSGYHTGLDFSAPTGTAVLAAKEGTVTVSSNSWGGPNFVTIDHGDDLQTAYAHMSQSLVETGDVVRAGDLIGAVGSEGNSTGPHLHFEVLVGGVKVDPMLFLAGTASGAAGWGGFTNGMIPTENLCPLSVNPNHLLRCDAAAAFNSMASAFEKDMSTPLCLTDSYRTYAAQVTLYGQKPSLAAIPGTSNHGWALAVDLCGGIESWATPAHNWMVKNAPRFGWVHPEWARQGGGREEPWHWEFGSIS